MKLNAESFYFMRVEPVDLRRYLPRWLNGDELFERLQAGLSAEHERYRQRLAEMARQFYIETTGDLQRWEQLLRIEAAAESSAELRRAVIRTKRRGGTMLTVENTKALLGEFAPRGEVGIRELGGNRLELCIKNGTFWWEELLEALMEQLPAHLTFDFELRRQVEQDVRVGLLDSRQGWIRYRHNVEEVARQSLRIVQSDLTCGLMRHGLSEERRRRGSVKRVGIGALIHGRIRYESEAADEYTQAEFERYLRERWAKFERNPLIKYYSHNNHEWADGELEDGEEFFPIEEDFLRLYWRFTDKTDAFHVRYTTILNPREGITAGEIKAVGEVGAATEMLLHSKARRPTLGIFRALYIRKRTVEII